MSWEDVYNVLRRVGGKVEMAGAEEIKAATAKGPGDTETQLRIAENAYRRDIEKLKGKEASDGQNRWHFA